MAKEPKKLFDDMAGAGGSVRGNSEPKVLFEKGSKSYVKEHIKQSTDKDIKNSLAQKLASVIVNPVRTEKPKEPKTALFVETGSESNIQTCLKYIENNHPELSFDKEKLIRQIKQLLPPEIENILSWGNGSAQSLAKTTEVLAKLSLESSTSNLIEQTLNWVSKKPGMFGLLFSKEIDLESNKKLLSQNKSKYSADLTFYDELEADLLKIEDRLKTNYLALIGVRECFKIDDSSIKSCATNRSQLLCGCLQQLQLNKLKLEHMRKNLTNTIHQIDQLLMVTIPAFEAGK